MNDALQEASKRLRAWNGRGTVTVTLTSEESAALNRQFERDLQAHVQQTSLWIAVLVFFFGVNVFNAAQAILTPGGELWLQGFVVMFNIGAAVYAWHVAMGLALVRAEWLRLLGLLRAAS